MLKQLLALFFQSRCPLCSRLTEDYVCQACQQQIKHCQSENPCQFWQRELPLFVWGSYGGSLKRAIAALKYEHHPAIGELLGYWLGQAWLASPLSTQVNKLTVIPIPLHSERLKERGFNQAEIIARAFCQVTHYSLLPHGLVRVRSTEAMYKLSASLRAQNLDRAFEIGKSLKQHLPKSPVLLIDDIHTTGATARGAARVLHYHNVRVFGVAAVSSPKLSLLKAAAGTASGESSAVLAAPVEEQLANPKG